MILYLLNLKLIITDDLKCSLLTDNRVVMAKAKKPEAAGADGKLTCFSLV